MKTWTGRLLAWFALMISLPARSATYYVNVSNTAPVAPYATWATAATNIQNAVDLTSPGDLVLVGDGIYNQGGGYYWGATNRLTIKNAITVQSVNGPRATIIEGYQPPGATNGPAAIRCVNLAGGAMLSGFTLANGGANGDGGGIFCDSASSIVTNCIIIGNTASSSGGGGYDGTYRSCTITGNSSLSNGGGVNDSGAKLDHCLIAGNSCAQEGAGFNVSGPAATVNDCVIEKNTSGQSGGGVFVSGISVSFNNCSIVANKAGADGGGAYGGVFTNCIIYFNADNSPNYANLYQPAGVYSSCTSPTNNLTGSSNLIASPAFVNVDAGDVHLATWSPCVDAGNSNATYEPTDLDGNPRILGKSVDMGAYEYQEDFTNVVHFVSLNSTKPVSPYTNWQTAATSIQTAINVSSPGDYVVVSNGVYNTGSQTANGSQNFRVVVDEPVTVQGLSGQAATTIQGVTSTTSCVYLTNDAMLMGLTLSNGSAGGAIFGGGVRCQSSSASVSNCTIIDCGATYGGGAYSGTLAECAFLHDFASIGGGAYSSTLVNCTLTNNTASQSGGGAFQGLLINCLLISNRATYGAGAISNTLVNCQLLDNGANFGGGAYSSTLTNCVLAGNSAVNSGGGAYLGYLWGCTLTNNYGVNGGGASSNIMVNCLLAENTAMTCGGGAYAANLTNCTVFGCRETNGSSGGGLAFGTATDCLLISNSAAYGGGAASNTLNNCTLFHNSAIIGGGLCAVDASACVISNNTASSYGGGSADGILNSCLIISNYAQVYGGGSYKDTVHRCWIEGNQGLGGGGGAEQANLDNCLISGNFTTYLTINPSTMGGGAENSMLTNCTVCYNTAGLGGGVSEFALSSTCANCIIYDNASYNGSDNYVAYQLSASIIFISCCTTPLPITGSGNITNAPIFMDSWFHSESNSPCIAAGSVGDVFGSTDYDGRPRIVNGAVDIGATQYQGPVVEPFISWLDQYGLPDDGSADYLDSDGTGLNNWQKWIAGLNPTNPASILAMNPPAYTNGVPGVVVSWQSETNVLYYLLRGSDLTGAFTAIQSNIVGQAGTTGYTDLSATNGTAFFYRVGVQY